jgi:hypothetical protein
MKIEKIPTDKLIPYARNAKKHDAAQVSKLAGSIREFGFNNPVLIDKDNGIIAGHGRVMAAQQLGLADVPCIRLGHLTDNQRKAYILADNRLAEIGGGWDQEMLGIELSDLREADFDLDLVGFEGSEIEHFLNPPELSQDVLQGGDQGKTPADQLENYENSTIRQIVLIMGAEEFEEVMKNLGDIKKERGLDSNTEATIHAIKEYANNLTT